MSNNLPLRICLSGATCGSFLPLSPYTHNYTHTIPHTNTQFDSEDLSQCRDLWGKLATMDGRWGRDWALAALAAAQRTEVSLSNFGDTMYNHVQVRGLRTAAQYVSQLYSLFQSYAAVSHSYAALSLCPCSHAFPTAKSLAQNHANKFKKTVSHQTTATAPRRGVWCALRHR